MTQIKKIKAEIESNIKALESNGGIYDSYEAGELAAYQEISSFIESLEKEPVVAINTWQDLQSVYVVTKRHLLVYDNCPIEQFPSSTEELFTEILNAIKGGERYE